MNTKIEKISTLNTIFEHNFQRLSLLGRDEPEYKVLYDENERIKDQLLEMVVGG